MTSDFQDPDTGRRGVGKFAHEKKPRSRHAHQPAETTDEHLIGPYDLSQEMLLFAGGVEASTERDSRGHHMMIDHVVDQINDICCPTALPVHVGGLSPIRKLPRNAFWLK